jgi:hypothetical protein
MIHKSSPQSLITLNTHCFQQPMLSLSHSRRAWYWGWHPNRDSGSWYKPLTCTIWFIMKLQRSPMSSKRLSRSSGVALIPFSSDHYKKTMLGFELQNVWRATASEVVLTYLTGVSPVCTGVTHGSAHVISTVYTPRLLLVVLFTYEIVK